MASLRRVLYRIGSEVNSFCENLIDDPCPCFYHKDKRSNKLMRNKNRILCIGVQHSGRVVMIRVMNQRECEARMTLSRFI